ncbi:UPF0303 protein [Rhizoctonia solani AG-1 IB]|uniref:UPF0303 protein n=1 Tax=Thanatephorus cucumeris (strain AG1-IB / isolate 7/3/14) TaxID=1108050 RepID=A0A0B7FNX0_THACB|nr:UPF0303 protein [Rhizoctonia solani AG-1 IB]
MPSDSEIASATLTEEFTLRFPSFKSEDAVTLGLILRKRFRGSMRHAKGKGLVITIQTVAGHTLFACTVGEGSDVSLDSWMRLNAIVNVVKRTGHSSFYVSMGMKAVGKTQEQLGLPSPEFLMEGGAFPIWLQNSPIAPMGVVAVYGGSSQEDHNLVTMGIRDFFNKMAKSGGSIKAGEHSIAGE